MNEAKRVKNGTTMVRDLTEGNVVSLLFSFAMPLFVANALQAIYNLVDMIVVGQVIGGAGMSAVSIGGDVLHLLTFLAMGFSSAGQVIIAQLTGAKRMDDVRRLIGTMFTFLLIIALTISVVCYTIRFSILGWLNTPAESFDFTMDYMVTCIIGLVFIYGYNIVSAILRGMGDSRRPFVFIAIAAVLNTILDILFVGVLGMQVFGAALATVIGQGFSFIVSLIYLYRNRESFGFDFRLESFRIDRRLLPKLLSLGIPMAIQSAAVSMSKVVLMAWINAEGVVFSALSGIYNKIGMMTGVVSNSFTTAGSSMIGQNLGAGKYDRVPKILRAVIATTMFISAILTVLTIAFPRAMCEMFTSDQAVLAECMLIIGPLILNYFGCATRAGAFALINGSGNSKLNLLVALIDGMISRVGFAALLGFGLHMRSKGFWYGDAIAGCIPMVIGGVFYLSGKWKKDLAR